MASIDNVYDFTKAKQSASFKSDVLDNISKLEQTIEREKALFLELHDELEFYRKQRSAIIESVIKNLKENDMKSEKPLGRYDNKELLDELNRLIEAYPEKDTEFIELATVKIRRRTRSIEKVTRKLIECKSRIENYINSGIVIMPEADYKDEVVISLSEIRNRAKQNDKNVAQVKEEKREEKVAPVELPEEKEVKIENEELEEVVGTHEASEELVDSLLDVVVYKEEQEESLEDVTINDVVDQVLEDLNITKKQHLEELAGDLDELNIVSFLNTGTFEVIEPLEEVEEEYEEVEEPENASEEIDENREYIECTMGRMLSLQKMAEMVYQQEDNNSFKSELWTGVYNYGQNKEIIDRVADRNGVSVDEVVTSPGYLENVTLAFPTELTAYKKVKQEDTQARRAA